MIRLTRHGWREMLIGSLVLVATAVGLGFSPVPFVSLLTIPVLIFLFAFFRDPHRNVPAEQHAIVSPADGTVSDITEIDHDPLLNGPAVRIGIFLSVFNVHVNRSPCDGRVVKTRYKQGKFINAMRHDKASDENESNTIILAEPLGDRPIAVVKQIVGLIARRIICTVKEGERVARGQRIGMIKFGSRTELYLPLWLKPRIVVKIGQSVRGAADVLAVVENPIHTEAAITSDEEVEPIASRETPA
jgi:phosphatidylserine decarboxylase